MFALTLAEQQVNIAHLVVRSDGAVVHSVECAASQGSCTFAAVEGAHRYASKVEHLDSRHTGHQRPASDLFLSFLLSREHSSTGRYRYKCAGAELRRSRSTFPSNGIRELLLSEPTAKPIVAANSSEVEFHPH